MNAQEFIRSRFLKAGDHPNGKMIRLRIVNITKEELGQDGEEKLCLQFSGLDQTLALNRTQTRRMVDLFGGNTDDWKSKAIALTVIPTVYKGEQKSTFAVDRDLDAGPLTDEPPPF